MPKQSGLFMRWADVSDRLQRRVRSLQLRSEYPTIAEAAADALARPVAEVRAAGLDEREALEVESYLYFVTGVRRRKRRHALPPCTRGRGRR